MLTAPPAHPRGRRLASLVIVGTLALAVSASSVVQSASAATASSTAPRAPGAYALTYSFYETPSDGKSQWIEFYPNELDASGGVPITGYVVRRSGGSPARDAGWTSSVLPAWNSGLTLTYLKPATTYDAYVRAVNQYGQSPETRVTFRTASVPPAPAGTKAALLKGAVKISWSDPEDCWPYRSIEGEGPWCDVTATNGGSGITGWRVSRDGTDIYGVGAYSTVIGRTNADGAYVRVFNKTLTNLKPGVTYNVSVQAINRVGTGPKSTRTVVIPAVPTAPAIGTAVAGVSGGAINAKAVWSKPTNPGGTPTSYTVYAYRMSGTTTVETLTKTGISPTATSYTFPLTRTGNWRFRVKATNAAGTSAYSAYSNTVAGR